MYSRRQVANGVVATSTIAVTFQCNSPKIAIIEKIREKFMLCIDFVTSIMLLNAYSKVKPFFIFRDYQFYVLHRFTSRG